MLALWLRLRSIKNLRLEKIKVVLLLASGSTGNKASAEKKLKERGATAPSNVCVREKQRRWRKDWGVCRYYIPYNFTRILLFLYSCLITYKLCFPHILTHPPIHTQARKQISKQISLQQARRAGQNTTPLPLPPPTPVMAVFQLKRVEKPVHNLPIQITSDLVWISPHERAPAVPRDTPCLMWPSPRPLERGIQQL